MSPLRWRRHGRGLAAVLALAGAVATIVVIVLVSTASSGRLPSAGAATANGATTTVQRRNLVQTDTESGTLSYAHPATVYNRLSGTITWLPSVGQVIKPGQALFAIDNQPVILLSGATPAYRPLTPSDSRGPDITELNRNLVALGFNPDGIVVDDAWQAATTAGVEAFQASLGESETGSLSLGRVVFLPGPQVVATVTGTVGSTAGGSGNPQGARLTDPPPHAEFVDLTSSTPTTSAPSPTPAGRPTPPGGPTSSGTRPKRRKAKRPNVSPTGQLQALIALLQAEIAQLRAQRNPGAASPPSSPKPSSGAPRRPSHTPSSGGTPNGNGGSATAILTTTSNHLVVTVNLPATAQSEAAVGEKVSVAIPNGDKVAGVITAVSPVAQTPSSNNGNDQGNSAPTIPVTIRLLASAGTTGLDQAAVSVVFAQAKATNVLSVPVTALLATSGTSYAVQTAGAPHRLVAVSVGLFAAGYVQISGSGIYPGLQVTDSQG